ncbi:hypothetical protein DFP73DRAFT_557967 [Morchella snyderi]|nr:hypothetical protein DFP73DRAFT_557967 [Morchella snyderi]
MLGRTLGSAKPAPHTAHHKRKERKKNHSLHIFYCHFCGVELYLCLFGFVQPYNPISGSFFGMVFMMCVADTLFMFATPETQNMSDARLS